MPQSKLNCLGQDLRIRKTNDIPGLNKAQKNHLVTFTKITKAVQIRITDPDARVVLIESLTFENTN